MNYADARVLVTGCYSGIGRATAQQLLDLGAKVIGLDIKPNDLALHAFIPLDLRDPVSIEAAVGQVSGTIDAVFNCAGVPPGPAPIDVMKVNFIGTRHLTELLLPLMGDSGAIANVASNGGAGWRGHLEQLLQLIATDSFEAAVAWFENNAASLAAAYSFSKEAVIVWTLAMSADLIRRGIRVNCTTPGAVQTPMLEEIERTTPSALIDVVAQPIGRRSQPEEQASVLLFLNSAAASYINGAIVAVDGGFAASQELRLTAAASGRR